MASGAASHHDGPFIADQPQDAASAGLPALATRPLPYPGPWRRILAAMVIATAGICAAAAFVVAALAGAVIGVLLTIGALAARVTPHFPRRSEERRPGERAPPGWRLETAPQTSPPQPLAPV